MSRKYIVTWDMLQAYATQLANKLLSKKKWKHIIAVSRGGLVPATILARELDIRFIDTICISSYRYEKLQNNVRIIKQSKIDSEDTLVIDDLSDTGRTARIIRRIYPKSFFVTIFSKPKGCMLVDDYIVNVPQDIWIEQPWDMKVSYSFPLVNEPKNYLK